MKKIYGLFLASFLLAACSEIPRDVAWSRGTPESLLDVSSEVVNIGLTSGQSVDEIAGWINQDQPSRAELYCVESDPLCSDARQVLDQFGVPAMHVASGKNSVALIYERVLARDCDNRYLDNPVNPYNWSHPTFGCSLASNIVQQVSDKRQFVSPALMDYRDGEKTVQAYRDYLKPASQNQTLQQRQQRSLLQSLQQLSGGGGR